MFGMHLRFVCKMNMLARIFVVCTTVLTTIGTVEIKSSDYINSVVTTKPNEVTTPSWRESTKINKLEQTTSNKVAPTKGNKWEQPDIATKYKESARLNKWGLSNSSTKLSTAGTNPANRHDSVNHGVIAVASAVGDSRNGRLSSMNSIEFYPRVDSSMVKADNKGNFIVKSVNGKMPKPITITKQGDGVSGTIRILPGSISVSSSASSKNSEPASAVASFNSWPNSFMMPPINDIYFPPFPRFPSIPDPVFDTGMPDMSFNTRLLDPFYYPKFPEPNFNSRVQNPWIQRNIPKQSQPEQDIFTPKWYYPSFNPFMNFW